MLLQGELLSQFCQSLVFKHFRRVFNDFRQVIGSSQVIFETPQVKAEFNAHFFLLYLLLNHLQKFIYQNVCLQRFVVNALSQNLQNAAAFPDNFKHAHLGMFGNDSFFNVIQNYH
jgi:hypothetical protein